MVAAYLVTGGTGLIGSNVCTQLVERGDRVRALVRPGSDHGALVAAGVEPVGGDVRSLDDLVRAADGCGAILHAAALLGGAVQDGGAHEQTNLEGAVHAYDAGARHGIRVVTLSSTPFLDHRSTLTESSPVADAWHDDPYTQTKGAAYVEAKRRAAEGADINVVIPGATFGPGAVLSRAMGPTSYNRTLRGGINGKVGGYISYPAPWVLAADVAAACIAAADRGRPGATYLAFGAEDAMTTAAWLNVGCEAAGVAHRIEEIPIGPEDDVDPAITERFGVTQVGLARRRFPVPWFDNAATRAELDYRPGSLVEAMAAAIPWLRSNGQIS